MAKEKSDPNDRGNVAELRRAVRQADSGAFLVEARVVRRTIRELHGYARLASRIPHSEIQVTRAADVRRLTHPDELGLESFRDLPDPVTLVALPDEQELETRPLQELMLTVWRQLFHGAIDRAIQARLKSGRLTPALVREHIDTIGQVEFDEAHAVLIAEQRLIHPESRVDAFAEFAAVWWEQSRFAPDMIPIWFPSLADRERRTLIPPIHVDPDLLSVATRLYGAIDPDTTPQILLDEVQLTGVRQGWFEGGRRQPSARRYARLEKRRQRSNERGNTVAAGVAAMKAAEYGPSPEECERALQHADEDIASLVNRLQQALTFDDEDVDSWQSSLKELVRNSTHGFWNSDKKLLFDLQKVCLDHERITYQVDLVKWIVSRGKRPLRRPLTNIREVMMAKHLASSASRLVSVRLSGSEREQLADLLHEANDLAEEQMRNRMRPTIRDTLLDVGFRPDNVPENVALDKLIEESLDCIAQRGYLTMGYLRDAISRNDLKLADIEDPKELIRGDQLLRSDDRLDVALDGVYRRGEFYLRWLQIASSLAFGTPVGRFLTLWVAIPFGGAMVVVEGLVHLVDIFRGGGHDSADGTTVDDSSVEADAVDLHSNDAVGFLVSARHENQPQGASPMALDLLRAERAGVGPEPVETLKSQRPEASAFGWQAANRVPLGASPRFYASAGIEPGAGALRLIKNHSLKETGGEAVHDHPAAADDATAALQEAPHAVPVVFQPSGLQSDSSPVEQEESSPVDDMPEAIERTIHEIVGVPETPAKEPLLSGTSRVSLIIAMGLVIMALVHLPHLRNALGQVLRSAWSVARFVLWDVPLTIVRFPPVQMIWRSRLFLMFRRTVVNPLLIAWAVCLVIPWVVSGRRLGFGAAVALAIPISVALNSRIGRDTEELLVEWIGHVWHNLHARVFVALFDWIVDFFKWIMMTLERVIYAVDEWLRFHSEETWLSIVVKAIVGVVWSLVVFLVRIYVNLLIEPQLNPIKHFPVVTVSHKIMLPFYGIVQTPLARLLDDFVGTYLANVIVGTTLFLLPGVFGFLVWELKENWRLYSANRVGKLHPVIVGSHGETVARLVRPGLHSGTLPKAFARLRRLERRAPSFRRFSERRSWQDVLHHAERDMRRFAERDLIRLLEYCSVWKDAELFVADVDAASNSIAVSIDSRRIEGGPVELLFQEQSRWVVATVSRRGLLDHVTSEQLHSFDTALLGFYRKAGTDLVREQMERNLIGSHPYDVSTNGLLIWPDRQFDREVTADLNRAHVVRPVPQAIAGAAGLTTRATDRVVFSKSQTTWDQWTRLWHVDDSDAGDDNLPLACVQSASLSLLTQGG